MAVSVKVMTGDYDFRMNEFAELPRTGDRILIDGYLRSVRQVGWTPDENGVFQPEIDASR